jgi:hypothetical protein
MVENENAEVREVTSLIQNHIKNLKTIGDIMIEKVRLCAA